MASHITEFQGCVIGLLSCMDIIGLFCLRKKIHQGLNRISISSCIPYQQFLKYLYFSVLHCLGKQLLYIFYTPKQQLWKMSLITDCYSLKAKCSLTGLCVLTLGLQTVASVAYLSELGLWWQAWRFCHEHSASWSARIWKAVFTYCLCHEAAPLYFKTLLQPHLSLWIGWLSLETMSQIKGCSFFFKKPLGP